MYSDDEGVMDKVKLTYSSFSHFVCCKKKKKKKETRYNLFIGELKIIKPFVLRLHRDNNEVSIFFLSDTFHFIRSSFSYRG